MGWQFVIYNYDYYKLCILVYGWGRDWFVTTFPLSFLHWKHFDSKLLNAVIQLPPVIRVYLPDINSYESVIYFDSLFIVRYIVSYNLHQQVIQSFLILNHVAPMSLTILKLCISVFKIKPLSIAFLNLLRRLHVLSLIFFILKSYNLKVIFIDWLDEFEKTTTFIQISNRPMNLESAYWCDFTYVFNTTVNAINILTLYFLYYITQLDIDSFNIYDTNNLGRT